MNNAENVQNFTQFFDRWRKLESAGKRKRLSMQDIQRTEFKVGNDACIDGIQTSKKLLFHKKMPDAKR